MEKNLKEILVSKWLEGTLSNDELAQFEALDEYNDYMKLATYASHFKAPDFDSTLAYEKLQQQKFQKKNNAFGKWLKIAAAVILLAASAFFFTQGSDVTTFETAFSKQQTIELPDHSEVILNAGSSLSFNADKWDSKREVLLEGEAYFKVAKGKVFDVKTSQGVVSVLGTQFNVKNRENYFLVQTFEGLVGVKKGDYETKLPAGTGVQIQNNTVQKVSGHASFSAPTWTKKISTFESAPFKEVISELERQYAVKVQSSNTETNTLFTGSFTHTDLTQALKTVTFPMQLDFAIKGNVVVFTPK